MKKLAIVILSIVLLFSCAGPKPFVFSVSLKKPPAVDVLQIVTDYLSRSNYQLVGSSTNKSRDVTVIAQNFVYQEYLVGITDFEPLGKFELIFDPISDSHTLDKHERTFLDGYCELVERLSKEDELIEFTDFDPDESLPNCKRLVDQNKAIVRWVNVNKVN